MNPPRNLLQFFQHRGQTVGNVRQLALELAELRRHRHLHRAQLQPERDEPLLGAVVQIALDPPTGLISAATTRAREAAEGRAMSAR
jgi:hypothetical protein